MAVDFYHRCMGRVRGKDLKWIKGVFKITFVLHNFIIVTLYKTIVIFFYNKLYFFKYFLKKLWKSPNFIIYFLETPFVVRVSNLSKTFLELLAFRTAVSSQRQSSRYYVTSVHIIILELAKIRKASWKSHLLGNGTFRGIRLTATPYLVAGVLRHLVKFS